MGGVNWKRNLAVVWLSQYLGLGGFACAMPFIPLLLRDRLGVTDDALRGAYVSIYNFLGLLSFTFSTVFWGMMADRFGYKIMLLRAGYAAALFFPLLAFAPSVGWLFAIRFATSFFSGTYNAAQTLLVCTSPSDKQGFVLGSLSTALWCGQMSGYMAGGLIVHYFGYTAAFVTCGGLYLTGTLLVHLFVQDNFHAAPVRKDAAGPGRSAGEIFTPVVLVLMGLFLLMGIARRIDEPFLAMLVEVVNGRPNAAFHTGVVSAAAALGGFLSGVTIGYLSDRVDSRKLLILLLILSVICTFLQAVSPGVGMLTGMRFLSYFFAGGLMPVMQVMLARNTDPGHRGTFFGLSSSINTAGGMICALLGGVIAFYFNVRGILMAGAAIFVLMIPYSLFTFSVLRRRRAS